jgi:hypothetical protein
LTTPVKSQSPNKVQSEVLELRQQYIDWSDRED